MVCLDISDIMVCLDILALLLVEYLPVWWTPGASYPAPRSFRLDPWYRPFWWSGWGWFCVGSRFHPPRLMRWSLPLHSGGEGRPRQSCDILHTTPVYIVTHWAWCQRDEIYYTLYKHEPSHLINFTPDELPNNIHYKPTFIRDNINSRFNRDKLVCGKLNKALSTSVLSKQPYANNWLVARIIHNDKALANLAKISCTQIKVSLQYIWCTSKQLLHLMNFQWICNQCK